MYIEFLIFVLFNHFYKDGNYKDEDMPYQTAVFMLIVYELLFVIFFIFFFLKMTGGSMDAIVSKTGTRLFAICILIFLYPANYWFLLKRNGFINIYKKYKDSSFNTKKNRVIYGTILILLIPVFAVLIGNLKYIFGNLN